MTTTLGGGVTRQSIHRTRGIAGLLAALTLGTLGARLAPRASDVDEVWAMEDTYSRYVKAGDVEKYRTLWNEGFRGWPCHTEHPATKATITEWVREIRDGKITSGGKWQIIGGMCGADAPRS